MRMEKEFRERCAARGQDGAAIDASVEAVRALEAEAGSRDGSLSGLSLSAVETYLAGLTAAGKAREAGLLALARYFSVLGAATPDDEGSRSAASAIAVRLLAYLSPIGVLPAMAGRLAALEGEKLRDRVMEAVSMPPLGSPPESWPPATAAFVSALERELGSDRAKRVLTWNVHGVPASAHAGEREYLLAAPSIQAWLDGYHERQLAVLEKHAADGSLWYEQRITQRVVDYVRENPEILGGVVEGDRILMTKIPYDPDRYIVSKDPLERRRLACHCPLAAASITEAGSGVPPIWCNCSAGFDKFFLDVAFGEETRAEVLESVLAGDERCRFSVEIPERLRP